MRWIEIAIHSCNRPNGVRFLLCSDNSDFVLSGDAFSACGRTGPESGRTDDPDNPARGHLGPPHCFPRIARMDECGPRQ